MDPRTNRVIWRRPNKWWLSLGTGVLSTAGRLLFQGCGAGEGSSPTELRLEKTRTSSTKKRHVVVPCSHRCWHRGIELCSRTPAKCSASSRETCRELR